MCQAAGYRCQCLSLLSEACGGDGRCHSRRESGSSRFSWHRSHRISSILTIAGNHKARWNDRIKKISLRSFYLTQICLHPLASNT